MWDQNSDGKKGLKKECGCRSGVHQDAQGLRPAECAERLNIRRPSAGVLNHIHTCPYQGGFPSLTLPPAVHIPSGDPPRAPAGAIRAPFSTLVFLFAFRSDMWTAQQTTFSRNFSIFGGPGVDFRRFWVPKQVPAAHFFGVFSKTTILLKSCSRCGGSTVFKV